MAAPLVGDPIAAMQVTDDGDVVIHAPDDEHVSPRNLVAALLAQLGPSPSKVNDFVFPSRVDVLV